MILLWRAVACFAGGCGYGILYNSPLRTVFVIGALSMLGNELRLGLHDLGMGLSPATFFGALLVGLLASLVREPLHVPRIALTVPSIIIMTPGIYAFQTIVFLNQGNMLDAIRPAGLLLRRRRHGHGPGAARSVTERQGGQRDPLGMDIKEHEIAHFARCPRARLLRRDVGPDHLGRIDDAVELGLA